ncbi:hypothetical protein BDW74DRAFT_48922 [Aspergillus multicolor]|uniref:uncharacterized protein n=1 Tax=Aspergillus multicolor TaxID=41759 RepID=UPI003CCD1EE1
MEGHVHRGLALGCDSHCRSKTDAGREFLTASMPADWDCMLRSIRGTTMQELASSALVGVTPFSAGGPRPRTADAQPRLGAAWQSPILLSTDDALVWVFSWFSRPSLGFSVTFLADPHGLINLALSPLLSSLLRSLIPLSVSPALPPPLAP